MVLARKLRQDLGKTAVEASGTLGISSKTCEESGKERRTATRAPVAEMFSAVANSSNSLPFLSQLRTKTGMARGNRGQRRRSTAGFFVFTPALSLRSDLNTKHTRGHFKNFRQNPGKQAVKNRKCRRNSSLLTCNSRLSRLVRASCFAVNDDRR